MSYSSLFGFVVTTIFSFLYVSVCVVPIKSAEYTRCHILSHHHHLFAARSIYFAFWKLRIFLNSCCLSMNFTFALKILFHQIKNCTFQSDEETKASANNKKILSLQNIKIILFLGRMSVKHSVWCAKQKLHTHAHILQSITIPHINKFLCVVTLLFCVRKQNFDLNR